MFYKSYLDEFGREVESYVHESLSRLGKEAAAFWSIQQWGDNVHPRVVLQVAPDELREFQVPYELQATDTDSEIRAFVHRHVASLYNA